MKFCWKNEWKNQKSIYILSIETNGKENIKTDKMKEWNDDIKTNVTEYKYSICFEVLRNKWNHFVYL